MTQVVESRKRIYLFYTVNVMVADGDARSQASNNHDFYCVKPNYFGPRTLKVNGTIVSLNKKYLHHHMVGWM